MKCWIFIFYLFSLNLVYPQSGSPCPCCEEKYRQFDFWVGDWETTANGQIAGTNHIIILQDSCVIQENWESSRGNYTGTSYNYYDPQDDRWHQTWIDNQGQSLRLSGKLVDGQMVLESGEMKDQKGNEIWHKITWTPNPDGTVRQLWESKRDGTVQILFDGIYKRKNTASK